MYNTMRRTSSRPINIERSPDLQPDPDSDSDSDDDIDNDETEHAVDAATVSASYLNSKFNDLTVGSLPSARIERRFMSANHHHGNNDRFRKSSYSGQSLGQGGAGASYSLSHRSMGMEEAVGNGRLASHQLRDNDLSRSMPVPSAPFLASRRDRATGERLSR